MKSMRQGGQDMIAKANVNRVPGGGLDDGQNLDQKGFEGRGEVLAVLGQRAVASMHCLPRIFLMA